ncbi:hypothetical protein GQ457_02G040120 [Hibiscus cannabinus]
MGDLELVIEINSQVVLNSLESHTLRPEKWWEIFEDCAQGRCYHGHNACFAWSRAIESFGGMVGRTWTSRVVGRFPAALDGGSWCTSLEPNGLSELSQQEPGPRSEPLC